ncbi:UNVERIFIED_CONTAM: hypothetical protein FKN15_026886 [Acipenser sinensis]
MGIDRDWKQCRTKYKNLKYEYRTLQRRNIQICNPKRVMRFYDEVDAILRRSHALQQQKRSEEHCQSADLNTTDRAEKDSRVENSAGVICEALEDDDISTTSDDLTISPMRTKTKISEQGNQKLMQEHAKLSFIPSVAIEGGKHWTDDEVRALLHIWSDSNIQTKLEGAVRNKSIFEEIANKLQKFGIDRDWK